MKVGRHAKRDFEKRLDENETGVEEDRMSSVKLERATVRKVTALPVLTLGEQCESDIIYTCSGM